MAKQSLKIEAMKAWRSSLKTKIVEKTEQYDPQEKGIIKTYARAKNTY